MISPKNENNENISSNKIIEFQKNNLKKDILFFKEDILKDFRQIENKLNSKYDDQNSNIIAKLEKFENNIEAMNSKISQLSSLISTDKNIQQSISYLYEFKTKIEKECMNNNIQIKYITKELKESINNYNKIISDSIIYPGVIGVNCKFGTFREMMDYILLNLNQLLTIKDKNNIDFKSYKTKIESLVKSFKIQTDSIMMNTTEITNKKLEEFEKRFQGFLSNQESKLFDLKVENNKLYLLSEKSLNQFNILSKLVNDHKDEFKYFKIKFNTLNDFIKDLKLRLNMSEELLVSENDSKNQNSKRLIRNGLLAKSIIKKYISGEVNLNNVKYPCNAEKLKRQSSIIAINNDCKKNLKFYNPTHTNSNKAMNKRMTLGPDKISSMLKLEKKILNNQANNSTNSDKSLTNKSINYITEEKEEDIDYINIYKEKKKEDKNINKNIIQKEKIHNLINENIKENEKENDISSLYEEISKDDHENKDKKTIQKNENILNKDNNINDNNKENIKTILIKDDNNNKTIKNNIKKVLHLKQKSNNNIYEDINNSKKEIKDNFRTLSNEKLIRNNNNFQKIINHSNDIKIKPYNILNYQNSKLSTFKKIYNNNKYLDQNKSFNKASGIGLFDNNLKKKINPIKFNIIEMSFEEASSYIKKKGDHKKIINNNKDIEMSTPSERNNNLDKNKICKKLKMNYDNDYLDKIVNNNNNSDNNYLYNMIAKDDSLNYSSLDYLNYIQKNKIDLKNKKINLKKK